MTYYPVNGRSLQRWIMTQNHQNGHWDVDTENEQVKIFVDDRDIPMWISMNDCRQPASGTAAEDYGSTEDENYTDNYNDEDYGTYHDPFSGDYEYAESYSEMDQAYEDMLEDMYDSSGSLEICRKRS